MYPYRRLSLGEYYLFINLNQSLSNNNDRPWQSHWHWCRHWKSSSTKWTQQQTMDNHWPQLMSNDKVRIERVQPNATHNSAKGTAGMLHWLHSTGRCNGSVTALCPTTDPCQCRPVVIVDVEHRCYDQHLWHFGIHIKSKWWHISHLHDPHCIDEPNAFSEHSRGFPIHLRPAALCWQCRGAATVWWCAWSLAICNVSAKNYEHCRIAWYH